MDSDAAEPLMRMHHIGVVVPDLDKAADRYVSRFGYLVVTSKIHDPAQTAFVQFLRLPGDRACLELVSPDRANSKLSHALSRSVPLNHICLATSNIEKSFRHLRANGMMATAHPTPAVAFNNARIAWLMGTDRLLTELVAQRFIGEWSDERWFENSAI